MLMNGKAGLTRAMCLCAGVAGLALTAGAAYAQAAYPDYPPSAPRAAPPAPNPDYGDYPAPPPGYGQAPGRAPAYADPRYQDPRDAEPRAPANPYRDPRYADPDYQAYQQDARVADPRDQDPRYAAPQYRDPRYQDPREEDARYPDPRYQASQYQDPRYQDPRDQDPRAERSARRRAARYNGQALSPYPPQGQDVYPGGEAAEAPPSPPAPTMARPAARVSAEGDQAMAAPHLPHRLTEAAQAYADYVKKTSSISAAFKSGASVAEAVKTGSGYEMHQFEEGAIAYAALTALQEPDFVAGVRELQREGARADFAEQLVSYPQAALNIRGADAAAARAAGALHHHGEKLVSTGAQVKQAAYDVQHSAWSKAEVANPDARLAAAKLTSAKRWEMKGEDAPELIKAVNAEAAGDGGGSPSPVVQRGLAIAALAVLGQLGDNDTRLNVLLQEPRSADCLKMAKLNLFQCLSVSRPHYEDIFCLGEHAMMETGQCVVKAAGYTPVPVTMASAGAARK
jgi:hypothetical protein